MKQDEATINTHALDVALEALFKTQGRDDAKRVYELLAASMNQVYAQATEAAAADKVAYFNTQIDQINEGWKAKADEAKQMGYEEGVASILFKQEVAKLRGSRGLPEAVKPPCVEETALVNAVSALN